MYTWPTNKTELAKLGISLVAEFCTANHLPTPATHITPSEQWVVRACAYYRPNTGINICLEKCATPCTENQPRNWSWPSSTTDREPYGVICHELGHHCDWLTGETKGTYYSEYCTIVKDKSQEPGVTGYANENHAEWFAEAFRLFVTNPQLLQEIRPKTYQTITEKFTPVRKNDHWQTALGTNVPAKILRTLKNKGAAPTRSAATPTDDCD